MIRKKKLMLSASSSKSFDWALKITKNWRNKSFHQMADAESQSKKDRLFQERLKSIQSLEKSLDDERKQLEQQHREGVLSKEGRKKALRLSNFNSCPGGITNFVPFCSFWKIFDRRNILSISFFLLLSNALKAEKCKKITKAAKCFTIFAGCVFLCSRIWRYKLFGDNFIILWRRST